MFNKKSILVVDDENINREIVKEMFTPKYKILEAEDGDEALQMVNLHYDDICFIILDIVMPNRDGVSVLKEFSNDPKYYHFPVAVVSSLTKKSLIKKTMKLGAKTYFTKPVNIQEVFDYVNRVVSQ